MNRESPDLIQSPRRMVFDWYGTAGKEPHGGDFMQAQPSGRTYLVLSARPVQVRVTRGETLRQSLELVVWPDAVPAGSRLHRFHWNKRERRAPRRLRA